MKVLIVDDVDYIQKSIRMVLESNNFSCDTADNGKIAIEKLSSKQYDMIITDIMMPEVDGFELLDHIRLKDEKHKNTSVLAISGGSKTINSDVALRLINEKANGVLQKPFAKDDLLSAIEKVIGSDALETIVTGNKA